MEVETDIIANITVQQKSLKIPKGQSKSANRRTDSMVKRKRTKEQTMIYKTQHRKLKTKQQQYELLHLVTRNNGCQKYQN